MMVKLLIYHTGMCIKGPESWWIAKSITPQLVVNQSKTPPAASCWIISTLVRRCVFFNPRCCKSWDCPNPPTFRSFDFYNLDWILEGKDNFRHFEICSSICSYTTYVYNYFWNFLTCQISLLTVKSHWWKQILRSTYFWFSRILNMY